MATLELHNLTDREVLMALITEFREHRKDFDEGKEIGFPRCIIRGKAIEDLQEGARHRMKLIKWSMGLTALVFLVVGPAHIHEILQYLAKVF